MSRTSSILQNIAHRPYALPDGSWSYYQEWNNALFLHWQVRADIISPLIPANLEVDVLNNNTWVSIVPFTMEKIRPKGLPHIAAISNFHEINVRIYVTRDGKPGVYFLNIEAQKLLSVYLSRSLSGLPYEHSSIRRYSKDTLFSYVSHNKLKNFHLNLKYTIDTVPYQKTDIDKWLTERYCLYVDKGKNLYRYDTHHQEWQLKNITLQQLSLQYQAGDWAINDHMPDLAHFSEGVKVLAWKRVKLV